MGCGIVLPPLSFVAAWHFLVLALFSCVWINVLCSRLFCGWDSLPPFCCPLENKALRRFFYALLFLQLLTKHKRGRRSVSGGSSANSWETGTKVSLLLVSINTDTNTGINVIDIWIASMQRISQSKTVPRGVGVGADWEITLRTSLRRPEFVSCLKFPKSWERRFWV